MEQTLCGIKTPTQIMTNKYDKVSGILPRTLIETDTTGVSDELKSLD